MNSKVVPEVRTVYAYNLTYSIHHGKYFFNVWRNDYIGDILCDGGSVLTKSQFFDTEEDANKAHQEGRLIIK